MRVEHVRLTHNIDGTSWTSHTFRIILHDVPSAEYALDGALLDIELKVAKAFATAKGYRWSEISKMGVAGESGLTVLQARSSSQ